ADGEAKGASSTDSDATTRPRSSTSIARDPPVPTSIPRKLIVFPLALARSDDGVARNHFAVEVRAQFRRAFLRLVVNVVKAEAVRVAVRPLEVVHETPEEVAAHGHALGRRAPQVREVVAQVHHSVRVVDAPVLRRYVGRGATVLRDVNLLRAPELRDVARPPVERLRAD